MKSLTLVFFCIFLASCNEQKSSYGNAAFNAEYELAIIQFSENNKAIPKFESFPVQDIYSGKPKDFVATNAFERAHESKLRSYITQDAVFAGEYVPVTWVCGVNCINTVLVSKRTGKSLTNSFGGAGGERIIAMRPDSRLMVTKSPILSSADEYRELGYMFTVKVLDGDKLTELQTCINAPSPINASDYKCHITTQSRGPP